MIRTNQPKSPGRTATGHTASGRHAPVNRKFFLLVAFCLLLVSVGVLLRFWQITQNSFVFYDEAFYLHHNRQLGEMIREHVPLSGEDLWRAVKVYLRTSLASGKSLWFMLIDLRIFFGNVYEWFWARVLAAVFGTATLFLTFLFARRFYRDDRVAWIAIALLAVLPSHVFYSRIALQEALSTFLVLGGMYLYLRTRELSWRSFAAGAVFALAYFSNYRLIMLPFLLAVTEAWQVLSERQRPALRRFVWTTVIFFAGVFGVGAAFGGVNTYIIFSWIFHQGHLAGPEFHPVNLLSYPYYLFRLEGVLFGLIFLLAVVEAIFRRGWSFRQWPLFLVITQMAVFSLPEEKGARYICVVLPFLAMAVADAAVRWQDGDLRPFMKKGLAALFVIMILMLGVRSLAVASIDSDYREAVILIEQKDPGARFLSSQRFVQSLYLHDQDRIADVSPHFPVLAQRAAEGYRYFVLGPQAHITYPLEEKKFSGRLQGYLGFIRQRVSPLARFDHFSAVMLERFVFEHSSHLLRSIRFLRQAEEQGYGRLEVYDLRQSLQAGLAILRQRQSEAGQ
ncbi:MAG: phospholipid carrier-dependent glycosyltransferase [Candidatus Omnitrophota bacterium]